MGGITSGSIGRLRRRRRQQAMACSSRLSSAKKIEPSHPLGI